MKTRLQNWGNSLAVRIPKLYAEQLHLNSDSNVELVVSNGSLTVTLIPTVPQYNLEEMLSQVTPEQIHGETDSGSPVGREIL